LEVNEGLLTDADDPLTGVREIEDQGDDDGNKHREKTIGKRSSALRERPIR
jgi:hypothetical protein